MCDECAHVIRNALARWGGMITGMCIQADDILVIKGLKKIRADMDSLSEWLRKRCEGCHGCDKSTT